MKNKKRVVVIGGGHGQSAILRGLKLIDGIHITTIVTVADDGGSTGRLRRRFHIPAMGDVRNVMIALSKSETLLTSLMDYRFDQFEEEDQDVGGHNLGNLILTALTNTTGSFMDAITEVSKVLNVAGDIIPSTTEIVTLMAEMEDGTIVSGESNIPEHQNRIQRVYYQEEVKATEKAIEAIHKADIIIFGVGSVYTSILPNIIIQDIRRAVNQSGAKKYYLCNAMTQHGETDEFSLEDHVDALEKHLYGEVDCVIYASDKIPEYVLKRYEAEFSYPVKIKSKEHRYCVVDATLLDFDHDLIRHDPEKIKVLFERLYKEL